MLKIATKFAPNEAAFATAHAAGFRHAEIWLSDAVLRNWQNVAESASTLRNGARAALSQPGPHLSHATLTETAELYRALQCQCMVIHQPQFNAYAETLYGLHAGLRFAIENHKLNLDELERWAASNPGLTLDVEHVWKFTLHDSPLPELLERIRLLLERYSQKVRHVHLPGYLPGYQEDFTDGIVPCHMTSRYSNAQNTGMQEPCVPLAKPGCESRTTSASLATMTSPRPPILCRP